MRGAVARRRARVSAAVRHNRAKKKRIYEANVPLSGKINMKENYEIQASACLSKNRQHHKPFQRFLEKASAPRRNQLFKVR